MSGRILFRADAFPAIGVGDLMSLINLSFYFKSDGWETIFMVKSYPAAIKLVEKYGLTAIFLDSKISINSEVIKINNVIAQQSIDLVFFEITENCLNEYHGITSDVYKACVSFDGQIPDDIDLVIDWDVNYSKFFQPEKYPETMFLLGPEYVILPKTFDIECINKRKRSFPPKKLLICMGGADEYNFTQKVTQKVVDLKSDIELIIILGSGYEFKKELMQYLATIKNRFTIKENISTMFEEYMGCDVAVGAGGLVSSELVATGTPAILIAIYEHQEARCEYFAKKKWATYLGTKEKWEIKANDILKADFCEVPGQFFNSKKIVKICNDFRKE